MRLLLIADSFPPSRSSASVHMVDLASALGRRGHYVVALVPSSELITSYSINEEPFGKVLRVKTPRTKNKNYLLRAIVEFFLPHIMLRQIKKSEFSDVNFDGIIWYSPSIFFEPLIRQLKYKFQCKSYLILRDMFPDWAVDLGLINNKFVYKFLKSNEIGQYRIADRIGVNCPGNLNLLSGGKEIIQKAEVLWTWAGENVYENVVCSINLNQTSLRGRKIFVYTGNMGVAQAVDLFLRLAERLNNRKDIGFLFVGRGDYLENLKTLAVSLKLDNVLFYSEIDPCEIPALYAQCHVGLVSLDVRHKTHNIPGKFISYISNGLPVLANLNPGNDLLEIINNEQIGWADCRSSVDDLAFHALKIIDELMDGIDYSSRCIACSKSFFSTDKAVNQILDIFK